jgi:Asp-tRNA(Asn)/Glu-tRNA(Gln) amidotransferase A subunit family amidase
VRDRIAAAAERFPNARLVDLWRHDDAVYPLFMREVADVHRELFAEQAELYGEDVRIKVERCLAVTDAEAEAAARARERWREEAEAALAGIDLLLTPTLGVVAPLRNRHAPGDLDVRERMIRNTFPFNALGWPTLALPCGAAEYGLPASLQIAGRPGADALVLAAGASLERVSRNG